MTYRIKDYEDEIYTCNRSHCGFCQEGCPAYRILGFESYSSRGRMLVSRALLEEHVKIDKDVVDIVHNCFLCGFCNAKCALYPTHVFMALRREVNLSGMTPEPLKRVISNITRHGNPYAFPHNERILWMKDKEVRRSHVLFFPGCVYSYIHPKQTWRIYKLLSKVGINIGYAPETDYCCGYPTYLAGDIETFQSIAMENYKKWKDMGVRTIYTPCPGCFKALGEHYPEFIDDFDIEVKHVIQGVFEVYDKGSIRLDRIYGVVTYHDPCELTRFMKVLDEPRKIIEAISAEFVELDYSGYFAKCCGGGGLVSAYNPKLALKASVERAIEISMIQPEIVTTFCPTCERTLSKGIKRAKVHVKLMDLGEMILEALR